MLKSEIRQMSYFVKTESEEIGIAASQSFDGQRLKTFDGFGYRCEMAYD